MDVRLRNFPIPEPKHGHLRHFWIPEPKHGRLRHFRIRGPKDGCAPQELPDPGS
ncbi:hypothetical protein GHT09_007461 [Marmota monax]|uniref:Uncharacterized protein n=1 Tax=Marmota monax TaxID=9995 RepID=A0A834V2H5_MARMO|nr:hypothetical protein GHT09_007461 [Marmota monax]